MDGSNENVSVVQDSKGKNIVVIHNILFKGKRNIKWQEVEKYLKQYVGETYRIGETKEVVHVGVDFPDEYAHSEYTSSLRGANAKAKANAAQGLGKLLEIATNKKYKANMKKKHNINAANGWYRYDSGFALPVYGEKQKIERYNVFYVQLIVRHDQNGKKYVYDVINIKKETSTPLSC